MLSVAALVLALTGCGTGEVAEDSAEPVATPTAPPVASDLGAEVDELALAAPGCASFTSWDHAGEYRGERRLVDLVPDLTKGKPDSLSVRRDGPDRAFVRMRAAAAPRGIQLQVFFAERTNGRWKIGGSTEGPVGCAELEHEFERPGKPLPIR